MDSDAPRKTLKELLPDDIYENLMEMRNRQKNLLSGDAADTPGEDQWGAGTSLSEANLAAHTHAGDINNNNNNNNNNNEPGNNHNNISNGDAASGGGGIGSIAAADATGDTSLEGAFGTSGDSGDSGDTGDTGDTGDIGSGGGGGGGGGGGPFATADNNGLASENGGSPGRPQERSAANQESEEDGARSPQHEPAGRPVRGGVAATTAVRREGSGSLLPSPLRSGSTGPGALPMRLGSGRLGSDGGSSRVSTRARRESVSTGYLFPLVPEPKSGEELVLRGRGESRAEPARGPSSSDPLGPSPGVAVTAIKERVADPAVKRHEESQAVRKHLMLMIEHSGKPDLRDRAVESGKRFLETIDDRHVSYAFRCLLTDFDKGSLFTRRARFEMLRHTIDSAVQIATERSGFLASTLIRYFVSTTHDQLREQMRRVFASLVAAMVEDGAEDEIVRRVVGPLVQVIGTSETTLSQRLASLCVASSLAAIPPLSRPFGLAKAAVGFARRVNRQDASGGLSGDSFPALAAIVSALGSETPRGVVNDIVCRGLIALRTTRTERGKVAAVSAIASIATVSLRDGLDVDPDGADATKLLLPFRDAILEELPRHTRDREYSVRRAVNEAFKIVSTLGANDGRGPAARSPVRIHSALLSGDMSPPRKHLANRSAGGAAGLQTPSGSKARRDIVAHYANVEKGLIAEARRTHAKEVARLERKFAEDVEDIKRRMVAAVQMELGTSGGGV